MSKKMKNIAQAEVLTLKEQISYQEGQVVSKNFHPHNGHALDIVVLDNLRQLFAVIHVVQLGAANQQAVQENMRKKNRMNSPSVGVHAGCPGSRMQRIQHSQESAPSESLLL